MLTTVLDQVGKIRESRLLLVGFAPTLVLVAAVVITVDAAQGSATEVMSWWDASSGTAQVVIAVGAAAVIFVLAEVVLANTTRLIQLLEGLPWEGTSIGTARVAWHTNRRNAMVPREYPQYLRTGTPKATGLGNALFTGERHAELAYGIQPVALWSRLIQHVPADEQAKLDQARTSLDFLVVVTFYAAAYSTGMMIYLSIVGTGAFVYFVAVGSGLVISLVSYIGAVQAALGLATLIATAADLYRHEVLQSLRLPLPTTPDEEERLWVEVDQLIRLHAPITSWVYQEPE